MGSAIVEALLREGWNVRCASRREPAVARERTTWLPYDLRWHSLPPDFGTSSDVLIHAALDVGKHGEPSDANVTGTRHLLDATRKNGVAHRIFISSFAASSGAASRYGIQKRTIEEFFDRRADAIVRPGLVIGNGGLFKALCTHIARGGVVPLIDGGAQPLQTVLDEDLARVIARIAHERAANIFTIAEESPVAYRTFLATIAKEMRAPIRFINIPFWLADLGAKIGDRLPVSLPVGPDQVLGLMSMRAQEVTHGAPIVPEPVRPYDQSIRMIVPRLTQLQEAR